MTLTAPKMTEDLHQQIESACAQACELIAPAWPLDRAIAVNPHWERVGMPVRTVAARMAVFSKIQVFAPRDYLLNAWETGHIQPSDLACAYHEVSAGVEAPPSLEEVQEAVKNPRHIQTLPLLIDLLDNDPERHTRLSWRDAITYQVSQTCAAYFDEHQADWQPDRDHGLYAFWRDTLTHDQSIGFLMGLPALKHAVEALPQTAQEAERWVIHKLGLDPSVWVDYLEAVLLTINGWASWCAYLRWQARLEGGQSHYLRELLAIRLAWGVLLLECKDDQITRTAFSQLQQSWAQAKQRLSEAEQTLVVDEVWQRALECAYQRDLAQQLTLTHKTDQTQPIDVQAAFCIDVRSERIRRALENHYPGIQTLGFAGFFGLPIAYTPLATQARRPQLPGLLSPAAEVTDRIQPTTNSATKSNEQLEQAVAQKRLLSLDLSRQWASTSKWPTSSFSFVEAFGIGYLSKLKHWITPSAKKPRPQDDFKGISKRYRPICRPQLSNLDLHAKVELARSTLQGMGLTQQLAPLVLLVGHGSQTTNNAHAASLDCGACCGQTGEVNARALAHLLNEPQVQAKLIESGIQIPEGTAFLAVLHNTTTDELEPFDLDLLPPQAQQHWASLQAPFAKALDQVRRERAPSLGYDESQSELTLIEQLRIRANDGAQTRPEWGLIGNASFLIAPRGRTAGLNLQGRSFLHDYDHTLDPEFKTLELLMRAPMLVTHWINWQYLSSTCDPKRLGSGNKVLQNVVGGHIGVFEGNGGDLRIGLSKQSLHDGKQWVHDPVRLTVVVDAPGQAIENILAKHAVVRHLVDHGWLHLWCFVNDGLMVYKNKAWEPVPTTSEH